jgi:hypothetical protein
LEELLPKDNENIPQFIGPVAPSEPAGFPPEEMIRCEECLRANPPTRGNCLYCGTGLPHTESSARLRKPTMRPPEKGQPGYNTIFVGHLAGTNGLESAAALLKLTPEDLQRLTSAGIPLPLARTATREEADLVLNRLRDLGFEAMTIADRDLGLSEDYLSRIRSMILDESGLTVLQEGPLEGEHLSWSNVVLIVTARLIVKKVELQERKGRKPESEIVNSSQFFADEAVVDIYASSHSQTWRITANSFDFSCLGSEKTLITGENMNRLVKLIVARAPHAEADDSYQRLRQILEPVWGSEQETESGGWRRSAPGKYSLRAVTTNSNESQFRSYSRLRYFLKAKSLS